MSNEGTSSNEKPKRKRKPRLPGDMLRFEREYGAIGLPAGPFAESYRIAGYTDGLVGGAEPECDVLAPHFDSGLTWPDENNPQPGDWLWDSGVAGGVWWDGTFYRDLARYNGSGPLFWSSYFKPGSEPGMQKGYWINFGLGWSHLHNDDPAQILAGASQRISYDAGTGAWRLVIQATKFVTFEVLDVWSGTKTGGNDPTGIYTRISGLDPLASLTIEAV